MLRCWRCGEPVQDNCEIIQLSLGLYRFSGNMVSPQALDQASWDLLRIELLRRMDDLWEDFFGEMSQLWQEIGARVYTRLDSEQEFQIEAGEDSTWSLCLCLPWAGFPTLWSMLFAARPCIAACHCLACLANAGAALFNSLLPCQLPGKHDLPNCRLGSESMLHVFLL